MSQEFNIEVQKNMTRISLSCGEYVYHSNQMADKSTLDSPVYLVLSGRVSCRLDRNVCFKEYPEGSYFGDIEVLNQSRRLFSVRAEGPLVLCVLDRNTLEQAFRWSTACSRIFAEKTLKRYINYKMSLKAIKLYRKMTENNCFWDVDDGPAEGYINNKLTSWLNLMGSNHKSSKHLCSHIRSSRSIPSFALKSNATPKNSTTRKPKVPRLNLFENLTTKKISSQFFNMQTLKELVDRRDIGRLVTEVTEYLRKIEEKLDHLSETLTAATRDSLFMKDSILSRNKKPLKDYSIKIDAAGSNSAMSQQKDAPSLNKLLREADNKLVLPRQSKLLIGPLQLNDESLKSDSAIISPVQSPTSRHFDRPKDDEDNHLHRSMMDKDPYSSMRSRNKKFTKRLSESNIQMDYREIIFYTKDTDKSADNKGQPFECVAEEWSHDSGMQIPEYTAPKIDLGKCVQSLRPSPPTRRAMNTPNHDHDQQHVPPSRWKALNAPQSVYPREEESERQHLKSDQLRIGLNTQASASNRNTKIHTIKSNLKTIA